MAQQPTRAGYIAPELRPWLDLRELLMDARAKAAKLAGTPTAGAPYAASIRDGLDDDLAELRAALREIDAALALEGDDEEWSHKERVGARPSMVDFAERLFLGPRR